MQAQTIDDVILRLEAIIKDAEARDDRIGYFAALYNRVTIAVREGVRAGEFDDGPRMERLDVAFANRFLDAYDAWRAGQLPSRAWLKAFEVASSSRPVVLQHLLVGMNAHIALDLGVAAAQTCPGADLPALKDDFGRINDVLAGLTPVVEAELGEDSPEFALLTHIMPAREQRIFGFGMDRARELAWGFACTLAPLPLHEQPALMAHRDHEVSLVADVILGNGVLAHVLRHGESTDVAANIRALAAGEFTQTVTAAHLAGAAS
ncbi:DUF5995 family protein [Nocardioides sp. cx-173]|uniref:DUF5995 family protein n=1 Tax=Nocardioides sp. cx-173 TaxID=2898796 RepID=UPI001E37F8B6|nr:DUF5995 family protein [Nocardioides sp. cx-173]MCD4527003.1 DUF5995 family protein [Nocardioides sp. cx-173]UGB41062.1 DUF5995 family protein [Nocardioides sp. cx-173]